ncbi:unnamed protein product [Calypogeia fissa]
MEKSAAAPSPASADSNGHKPKLIIEEKVKEKQRSKLAQEEAAIESKIVEHILDGQWEPLHPNSGTSVDIRGSHLCVDYHDEVGYRVWEWHGHCMTYEDGEGYTPEYIYGNYFEPLAQEEEVRRPVGLGLAANHRRVMPGLGGLLTPIGRQGAPPMRSILDEAYRRASK